MRYFHILILALVFASCNGPKLDYFGRTELDPETKDSVYHTIEDFYFISQDNTPISLDYLKGKTTIVNFFFTSCPSICPEMTDQMKRVQQETTGKYDIQLLSHTVDPQRDSVERLNEYIAKNNINTQNWKFVTGEKQELYEAGVFSYYLATQEDVLAPGGFLHSEKLVLIDKDLHIRGFYNGTEINDVNKLLKDLEILFNEYSK